MIVTWCIVHWPIKMFLPKGFCSGFRMISKKNVNFCEIVLLVKLAKVIKFSLVVK